MIEDYDIIFYMDGVSSIQMIYYPSKEDETYIEHRHDKSILSCTITEYNLFSIPTETQAFFNEHPFHARRIKN